MDTNEIKIVDRGRGLQLSTSRITVQDLVPYFQDGCSHEEILDCFPVLRAPELAVVEAYYRAHKDELDEEDRQIRERIAQRKNPPEIEEILRRGREKMDALRQEFENKRQQRERNGDNAAR